VHARLAALVLLTCMGPAFAEDGIGGSLSVVSDYVYRGISQSNEQPALQGDVHYVGSRGFSAGLWASTVQFNGWDGRTAELDAYLGYRWSLGIDWSAKLTGVHYAYPFSSHSNYDYDEVLGTLAFRSNLFLTAGWTFDAARYAANTPYWHHDALSYEAAAVLPLWRSLAANLGVGHYTIQDAVGAGYTYWNVGLGYDWQAWHVELNYIDTSENAARLVSRQLAGSRLAATLLWRF
jgi:uncharacterized protein (TIGR02001 family)